MPIYEYECSKCHHKLDLIQKMSDPPVRQCPECSGHSLVRLVSAAGFQLKGQGWYATDFKNKSVSSKQSDSRQDAKESSTEASVNPSTDKPTETTTTTQKKTQEGD